MRLLWRRSTRSRGCRPCGLIAYHHLSTIQTRLLPLISVAASPSHIEASAGWIACSTTWSTLLNWCCCSCHLALLHLWNHLLTVQASDHLDVGVAAFLCCPSVLTSPSNRLLRLLRYRHRQWRYSWWLMSMLFWYFFLTSLSIELLVVKFSIIHLHRSQSRQCLLNMLLGHHHFLLALHRI